MYNSPHNLIECISLGMAEKNGFHKDSKLQSAVLVFQEMLGPPKYISPQSRP